MVEMRKGVYKRFVTPRVLNTPIHWTKRKKINDAFKEFVCWNIKALAKCRKAKFAKIEIVIHKVALLDRDNAYTSVKAIVDGITLSGFIPDDSEEFIDLSVRQVKVSNFKDEQVIINAKECARI